MAERTFKIRMAPGPYRRELGEYVWDEANGWTTTVDAQTAANLLTYPNGGYWLAERPSQAGVKELAALMGVEPRNLTLPAEDEAAAAAPAESTVAEVAGAAWAAQLAEHGVTAPAQLAALDEEGAARLAGASGASLAEVRTWAEQARRQGTER